MAETERIPWEGLSGAYVQSKFRYALERSGTGGPEAAGADLPYLNEAAYQAPVNQPTSNPIVNLGYKYKNVILRIPVLRGLAKAVNRSLKNAFQKEYCSRDLDHTLGLDVNDFIIELYKEMLGREPDDAGFKTYQRLICAGMPKRALIYLLACSGEFGGRYPIRGLSYDKKLYNRFKWKIRFKRVPIIGWLYAAALNIRNINTLAININVMDADRRFRESQTMELFADSTVQLEHNFDQIQHRVEDLRLENLQNAAQQSEQVNQLQQSSLDLSLKSIDLQRERLEQFQQANLQSIDRQREQLEQFQQASLRSMERQQENVRQLQQMNLQMTYQLRQIMFNLNAVQDSIIKKSKTSVLSVPGGVIAIQTADFIIGVPAEEWRWAMYLSINGHFEYGTEKHFRSLLKKGMVVVDVGANLGIYTLIALSAECEVHSYEPSPAVFNILRENICANGFAETGLAHLNNMAVSDKDGSMDFYVCKNISGHSSLFGKEYGEPISVPVVSLDSHLKDFAKIDVIKIDVEGAEMLVFNGMREIIRRNPRIAVFMEFDSVHLRRAGVEPHDFYAAISEYGFNIQIIDDTSGNLRPAEERELMNPSTYNLLLSDRAV